MKFNKRTITILCILLVAGGGLFLKYRDAIFSKEILRLEILGPENVKAGEEVEYTVKYKNNGNFVLENPKLIFELPEHSLTEDSKLRLSRDLEDIYPGKEDFIKFPARLLGKEGDLKVARAWLSYIPKNLSARYESETTLTTKIESVPITLGFDLPTKAEKSKELSYEVNYFSNVDYPLENLSIKIDPVDGFNIKSANPASLDNVEWKLETLQKAQGGRIEVRGAILGNDQNILAFSARLGMWQNGTFIVIKEVKQEVAIIQPLLFISQQVNGFSDYVASPGEKLHYEVFLRNIAPSSFDNLFVVYRVDSNAFDLSSLRSQDGQAKANDNVIVFDYKQIARLRTLHANQEVKLEFDATLKDSWFYGDEDKNNIHIKNKVEVADITEEFSTKVSSRLTLSQEAYHSSYAGMENSGPVPPEAGLTTTYTIAWQVKNSFNDIKNIKVKAILPENATLNDAISPESQAANFSFDNKSRELVWLAGSLSAGSSTSLAFSISLTPGLSQRGRLAELIGQATVLGEDQFTSRTTQSFVPAVNTSLPHDEAGSGGGIVK